MGDEDVDRPEPPWAKAITALLRETRSLSRRADKLSGIAAEVEDPTTQQLAVVAVIGVAHRAVGPGEVRELGTSSARAR